MKNLSAELLAHYAGDSHTLARLWKLTRRDGLVYGFTDHDAAITYSAQLYQPTSAYDASAISTKAELNTDNMEAVGLLDSDGITNADLEAGLWDGAAVWIAEVNYRDLTMGHNVLRVGALGEVSRNGLTYTAELRGLLHALQNNIGRIVKPSCDADLGDARCGVDLEALRVSGVVTTATSSRLFTTDLGGSGTYSYGVITWTLGANTGLSMEVKLHSLTGVIELQLAMPYPVQDDDEFTITPGCNKTKAVCLSEYDNVPNFRGFSFVPGPDKVTLIGGQ